MDKRCQIKYYNLYKDMICLYKSNSCDPREKGFMIYHKRVEWIK